ncbi:MAG: hypothetical protein IKF82_01225 [Bacilli bacterium]|nr:hypothetical protein [Bacilli bacterium]
MYIYFDNKGVLTTILQHDEPVIRQGSSFKVHLLFETDCPYLVNSNNLPYSVATIRFKKSKDSQFGNEILLTKQSDLYKFEQLPNENIFSLEDGKKYIHFLYEDESGINSAQNGVLLAAITIYKPVIEDTNDDGDTEDVTDIAVAEVCATGRIMLYVEEVTGDSPTPDLTTSEYQYLLTVVGRLYNSITGGVEGIDTGSVKVNDLLQLAEGAEIKGDLIPDINGEYKIGNDSKKWSELHLANENGPIKIDEELGFQANGVNIEELLKLLSTDVFGSENGQRVTDSQGNPVDFKRKIESISNQIGTDETNGSIKGRIKNLENFMDGTSDNYAPKRLNLLSSASPNVPNERLSLFANDENNNPIKISIEDIGKRIIRTANEIPSDLQVGQYLRLIKEEQ